MTNNEQLMREKLNNERLTDNEVDLLYDIVEITASILEKHNIRYIMEGGTLLGAVRNGGLIPHDNDADFNVLEDDIHNIQLLKHEFDKHDLEIIVTPGWGLQISFKSSPTLDIPDLWTDGLSTWTSKWPFLDLIAIKKEENKYVYAQDVAKNDYPNYYLEIQDWENQLEKFPFGHLMLFTICGDKPRKNYLDRHYPDWNTKIVMNMDHRKNIYFDQEIQCQLTTNDLYHRKHSKFNTS